MSKKPIKATKLKIGLPFNLGEIEFEPNDIQQRAAWSLYVELITRVAVQPLDPEEGLIREALTSLYAIFDITRQILKEAGPEVAQGKSAFGPVAIQVLNKGLRPFLAKWHLLLKAHEDIRPPNVNVRDHEFVWEYNKTIRQELQTLQNELLKYTSVLANIAGLE